MPAIPAPPSPPPIRPTGMPPPDDLPRRSSTPPPPDVRRHFIAGSMPLRGPRGAVRGGSYAPWDVRPARRRDHHRVGARRRRPRARRAGRGRVVRRRDRPRARGGAAARRRRGAAGGRRGGRGPARRGVLPPPRARSAGAPTAPRTRRPRSSTRWSGGRHGGPTRHGWSIRAPARAGFSVAAGAGSPAPASSRWRRDPLAALVCRGHLAAAGLAGRASVVADDYRARRPRRAGGADPLPRQPAVRAPPPDRAGAGRSGWRCAARCHGPRGERAGRAPRPLLPGHRAAALPGRRRGVHHGRRVARRELRAPGARRCCSARSAAGRSTWSSRPPRPSRTRR